MNIMYRGAGKSRAALIKEQLAEQKRNRIIQEGLIDLYPKEPEFNYQMKNFVKEGRLQTTHNRLVDFQEAVLKELVSQTIYEGMVEPVLNESLANTHHKELAFRTVCDFVNEHDCHDLIRDWKYKNIYLAEFAQKIEKGYDLITETAKDKLKEGLNEKDAFKIENDKIDDYIIDVKDVIPKDITNTVTKRVEDSINDFVADNQDRKDKILAIYQKAQDKISMNTDPNMALAQASPDGQPPTNEVEDSPEFQAMDPNALPGNNNPNVQMDAPDPNAVQQEALWNAKRKEMQIMNEGTTNVFGAMTKIFSEAALTIPSLQMSYLNENGRLNMPKILGDVRTIYTFLETLNTIGVIDATPKYIDQTLKELRESLETVSQDEKKYPSGDKKEPKDKTHWDGTGNDNNPSNDFMENIKG